MVILEPISIEPIISLVELAFQGDIDLLEKYHVSPGTLAHCVTHTTNFIVSNQAHFKDKMEVYQVKKFDDIIGFAVIIRHENGFDELYSFGINIEYRKNYILIQWLSAIKQKINSNFYIVLWSVNVRAINFFERNDFKVLRNSKYLQDNTKTLILCQREE